jgi:hypothetical protein
VTDPRHPKPLFHIPGEPGSGESGGAQMVRVCAGATLPNADKSKFYMLRTFGNLGHEVWDVTDPSKPSLLSTPAKGLKGTHKSFWECDTGIAYLVSGVEGWRTRRMTQVFDLSDPAKPKHIRDFGLPGQQPGATGPGADRTARNDLDGPKGNSIFFGYGTNKSGIMQIVDRDKLINGPKEPTDANLRGAGSGTPGAAALRSARTRRSPMLGMEVPEFAKDQWGGKRDFALIVDESLVNECQEARRWCGSRTSPAESKPFNISSWTVPEASGNFCARGGRFRLAFVQREHGAGVLQARGVHRVLQRRRACARRARSLSPEGDRLLHPGDQRQNRQALRGFRGDRALQGRDPDQQRGRGRARLRVHRGPRQHRLAYPRAHR